MSAPHFAPARPWLLRWALRLRTWPTLVQHAFTLALLQAVRSLERAAVFVTLSLSWRMYRGETGRAWLRELWIWSARVLPTFMLACALLGLVVVRIALVTAESYGLSTLAEELLVRVLVLELLPLMAALWTWIRVMRPTRVHISDEKAHRLSGVPAASASLQRHAVYWVAGRWPQMVAVWWTMLMAAAISGLLVLAFTYFMSYGFAPWGWESYTRMVGRVMDTATLLVLVLKVLLFALIVAVSSQTESVSLGTEPQSASVVQAATPRSGAGFWLLLLGTELFCLSLLYLI